MKRVFGMSTIPSRIKTLDRVIDSIYPSIDYGMVVFNSYTEIPEFMEKYPNVKCLLFPEGKLRAMAKFLLLKELKEPVYYFSCDDDFIYNENYFNYLENKAKTLKAIVTIHGRRFIVNEKIINFYKNTITRSLHWNRIREKDVIVPFGGTGVMCFSTELFRPENLDFIDRGLLADIWIGIEAKKRKIPIYCVPSVKIHLIKYPGTIFNGKIEDTSFFKEKSKDLKLATQEINKLFFNLR